MIKWKRMKNDIKESEDGRFIITKKQTEEKGTWYGIRDCLDPACYYTSGTLYMAKERAETLSKYHPAPIPGKIYRLISKRTQLAKKLMETNTELNNWLIENGFDFTEIPEIVSLDDPEAAEKAVKEAIKRRFGIV